MVCAAICLTIVPTEGRLNSFQCLAITSEVAMTIHVQVSVWKQVFISLG